MRKSAFDSQPTLTGELVVVRPLRPEDFEALYAVAADPLIWEMHHEPERWREDVFRARFDSHLATGGALIVLDRVSGAVIGCSLYEHLDESKSEVEIGWTFLARAYWGGRHNTDLKRVMLEHAFRYVDTVVFVVDADNLRSRRAVEKLGAIETGRARRRLRYEVARTAFKWAESVAGEDASR